MIHIAPKKNDILYAKDRVKCIVICGYQENSTISSNDWWYSSVENFLEAKDVIVVLEVLINKQNKNKRLKCLFKKKVIYIKESEFYNLSFLK
tara:strand:+ start:285 stop:560 length:276 start_codon:yes stop_codon:yes gene_type:complete